MNSIVPLPQTALPTAATFKACTQVKRHINISTAATDDIAQDERSGSKFEVLSGTSTSKTKVGYSKELYSKLESLFRDGKDSSFEDGIESKFSRELNRLIKTYSADAVEIIICLIVYEKVDPEVAGEALRWIGRLEHHESYFYRRWLLEKSLTLPSNRVRDGAILGLASMDDKHAIPYLKHAIDQEKCPELRGDIKQVLEQLES